MDSNEGSTPGPEVEPKPDQEAAPPTLPPRSSFLSQLRRFALPILCLLQFGLVAGLVVAWLRSGTSSKGPHELPQQRERSQALPPGESQAAVPKPTQESVDSGKADEFFRSGNYEQALTLYEALRGRVGEAERDMLEYRICLCLEALGRRDEALATYKTLAARNGHSLIAALAELSQARLYSQTSRPSEAKLLLYDLLLKSAQPALKDQPLLTTARHMLALALARECTPPAKASPLNDALTHAPLDGQLERLLEPPAPPKVRVQDKPAIDQEHVEVQPSGRRPEDAFLDISVRQTPIAALLDRIAEKAGLRLQWSAKAQQQFLGRTRTVRVEQFPLPDLLWALLDSLGLVWSIEEKNLVVLSEQEISKEALAEYHTAVAKRALREAVADPDALLTPLACLELGNMESAGGNLSEAIGWYERLLREFPRSAVTLQASYNLGIVQARMQNNAAARNAFYRVADQAPAHELAPIAYLRIGWLWLEDMETEQAIRPLRRALAAATGPPARPLAILSLAAAYLFTNNPGAANALLREHRPSLLQEPYQRTAIFLDSLARFRAATDRILAQREASDLLASILALGHDWILGSVQRYLIGQAYHELGLDEQMTAVYADVLKAPKCLLDQEMSYTLAEYWSKSGKGEAARQILLSLAETGNPRWAQRAQLRLAEIALREKRPAECLQRCRALLREPEPENQSAILKLMGQAFEQTGDYRQAALCFAGQMPDR